MIAALLTFLAGTFCFAAFVWGVRWHFESAGGMQRGMRGVSLLSLLGLAIFWWRLWACPLFAWPVALGLFAAALALFRAAVRASRGARLHLAFDPQAPHCLLRRGPYRRVRHPFYLAYMLFWLGTALAARGLAGWIVPVLLSALYVIAAWREERRFGDSALADAYAAYRTRAGMFWPLWRG